MTTHQQQRDLRHRISEGLASWLIFEHHSGRDKLFSERYLALPIAQILAHNLSGTIEAEHNHPILGKLKRRGRPPQLDFIIRQGGKVTVVVETKWAGARGLPVADLVWDCVRLELAAHHYDCDALFILAGRRAHVDDMLGSIPFNPNTSRGHPSPILGINGSGRSSVNIQSPKRDFGPALHRQLKTYSKVAYPRSFVCGTGTQLPRDAEEDTYTAAVWHIRPEFPVKRFTFIPK